MQTQNQIRTASPTGMASAGLWIVALFTNSRSP
jgi:hypothetical protein